MLAELEPLTEQTHDLQSTYAIHGVLECHGPGWYPAEELAALAGLADVDGVRRRLEQMLAAGLATYLRPRRRTIAAELTVLGARFPTRVVRVCDQIVPVGRRLFAAAGLLVRVGRRVAGRYSPDFALLGVADWGCAPGGLLGDTVRAMDGAFEPRDPDYERRVRESFARQSLLAAFPYRPMTGAHSSPSARWPARCTNPGYRGS